MHQHNAYSPSVNSDVDPLCNMPFMTVWRECVWAARITTHAKLVLLRIACFVDAEGRGCSVSYGKLAWDCNCSEGTVKRIVAKFKDSWLHRVIAGGRLIPRVGRENLYHVMAPPSEVDALRAHKLAYLQEQIGVSLRHPVGPGRGIPGTHVHDAVNQRFNSKESTPYGNCIKGESTGVDATDVMPNWADEIVGGVQ